MDLAGLVYVAPISLSWIVILKSDLLVDVADELGYSAQFPAIPKGNPNATSQEGFSWTVTYDSSKVQNLLGLTYRNKQELVKDTLEDFKSRGWI